MWRHQAITWARNASSSVKSRDIYLKIFSLANINHFNILQNYTFKITTVSLRRQWVNDGTYDVNFIHWWYTNYHTITVITQFHISHFGNTLRPRQNGRHFQMHFLEWKCVNFEKISLKLVSKGLLNTIPALVQVMTYRWPSGKPLNGLWWLIHIHHAYGTG